MSRIVDQSATPSLLARLSARFQVWRQHRQEMAELAAMGPRELADLGLTRTDLIALRKGVFQDTRESMQTLRAAYKAGNTPAVAPAQASAEQIRHAA